jgi:hypothetical protein
MSDRQAKLLSPRKGITFEVKINNHSIFLRTGEYEDGTLGEIFIDMYKEGAGYKSILANFSITVSWLLQFGVPLEKLVEKFQYTRFEPSGMVTGDAEIKMCSSILDYVFRRLGITYLDMDLGNVKNELPTFVEENITPKANKMVAVDEEVDIDKGLETKSKGLENPYLEAYIFGSGSVGYRPKGYKGTSFLSFCKKNRTWYDPTRNEKVSLEFTDDSISIFDRASNLEKVNRAIADLWYQFYKTTVEIRGDV